MSDGALTPLQEARQLPREKQLEALAEARRLILEVALAMDTTAQPCACCGATRYASWTQAQAYTELSAAASKLERWHHRLTQEQKPEGGERGHEL